MLKNELNHRRPSLFYMGLIVACSLTLTAFNWQFPQENRESLAPLPPEDIVDIVWKPVDIIREADKAPVKQASASKTTTFTLDPIPKKMQTVSKKTMKIALPAATTKNLRSPVQNLDPSPKEPKSIRTLSIHEMPYLRLCGHIKDDTERFQCSQIEMRKHIASNFSMPSASRLPDLPSKVQVQFVIDENGNVIDVETDEKVAGVLAHEIEKVFKNMPEIVPAARAGHRMAVRFELPMSFERR